MSHGKIAFILKYFNLIFFRTNVRGVQVVSISLTKLVYIIVQTIVVVVRMQLIV